MKKHRPIIFNFRDSPMKRFFLPIDRDLAEKEFANLRFDVKINKKWFRNIPFQSTYMPTDMFEYGEFIYEIVEPGLYDFGCILSKYHRRNPKSNPPELFEHNLRILIKPTNDEFFAGWARWLYLPKHNERKSCSSSMIKRILKNPTFAHWGGE